MSNKPSQNRTDGTDGTPKVPQILVPPKTAFRALGVRDGVGYRMIKEGRIPVYTLPSGRNRVPIQLLEKMINAQVKVSRNCATCVKKKNGKCLVFDSPVKDIANCWAWDDDPTWIIKHHADEAKYADKQPDKPRRSKGR